jgi:hypothetical protein
VSRDSWESQCLALVARRQPQSAAEAAYFAPAIITPELMMIGMQSDTKPLPATATGYI